MADGIKDKVAILGMGCSRFGERWESGAEDLAALSNETNGVEVGCDICGQTYRWDAVEAHLLFATGNPQIH